MKIRKGDLVRARHVEWNKTLKGRTGLVVEGFQPIGRDQRQCKVRFFDGTTTTTHDGTVHRDFCFEPHELEKIDA